MRRRRLADALDTEIPVALMTSFATDAAVRAHVAERGLGRPLWFCQTAAPRLRPDGSLFLDADGKASLYGPGHGDLLAAIRDSGTLAELVRRGVTTVVVSNVDNLGARIDPAIVGMHVLAGTPLTVEVVPKGSDTGGAPARVDGRPRLLEAMCFPPEFDQSRIPVFNTNTSLITVGALADPVDLTLARRGEARRGSGRRPVRAALPRALRARLDDVSRLPARRRAGPLPAGQGAGGSRGGEAAPARAARGAAPRPVGSGCMLIPRSRHGFGTKSAPSLARIGPYRRWVQLLDVLLPRRCGVCGRVGESVCEPCLTRLVRCAPPWCERCGAPGPWPVRRCAECSGRRLAFARARAAVVYEDGARAFVTSWKERGRRDLAAVAAQLVVAALPKPDVDVVAFVPGDRDRGLARGHTPAAALASELSAAWSIPLAALLRRRSGVARQRDLPRVERRQERGARVLHPRGVTAPRLPRRRRLHDRARPLTACATALRRAGARRVDVVCLARAVR